MHYARNFANTTVRIPNALNNISGLLDVDVESNATFGTTFPMFCIIGQVRESGLIESNLPYEEAIIVGAPDGQLSLSRGAPIPHVGTPTIMVAADARYFRELQARTNFVTEIGRAHV